MASDFEEFSKLYQPGDAASAQDSVMGIKATDAFDVNPEKHAQNVTTGQQFGLPADIVDRNPKMVERLQFVDKMKALMLEHPRTAGWISRDDNMKVAHDDIESFKRIENMVVSPDEVAKQQNGMVDPITRQAIKDRVTEKFNAKFDTGVETLGHRFTRAGQENSKRELNKILRSIESQQVDSGVFLQAPNQTTDGPTAEDKTVRIPIDGQSMSEMASRFITDPKYALEFAPFMGQVPELEKSIQLYGAIDRLSKNMESFQDLKLILEVDNDIRRGSTFWGGALETVAKMPAFVAEFASTIGAFNTGSAVGREAAMGTIQKLLGKSVKQQAKSWMMRTAVKSTGAIAGSIAQSFVSMPGRTVTELIGRQTPGIQGVPNADGHVDFILNRPTDGFVTALAKSMGSSAIEMFTERVGGHLIEKGAGAIVSRIPAAAKVQAFKGYLMARYLHLNPGSTVAQFSKKVANASGWNGVFAEMGEEELGKGLRYLLHVDSQYKPTTPTEFLQELIAFSVMPGGSGAIRMGFESRADAIQARQTVELFNQLAGTVSQSKTQTRLPDRMQQGVNELTKNGPIEDTFMPIEPFMVYYQSKGIDPERAARDLGIDKETFQQSVESGSDLKIKTSVYASKVATTDAHQDLVKHLRLSADAMNMAELEQKVADEQAVAKQVKQAKDDNGKKQVYDEITKRLESINFTPDNASKYAQLATDGLSRAAAEQGVSVPDLLDRYGVNYLRANNEEDLQQMLANLPTKAEQLPTTDILEKTTADLIAANKNKFSRGTIADTLKTVPEFVFGNAESNLFDLMDAKAQNDPGTYDEFTNYHAMAITHDVFKDLTPIEKSRFKDRGWIVNEDVAASIEDNFPSQYQQAVEQVRSGLSARVNSSAESVLKNDGIDPDLRIMALVHLNNPTFKKRRNRKKRGSAQQAVEQQPMREVVAYPMAMPAHEVPDGSEFTIYGNKFSISAGSLIGDNVDIPLAGVEFIPMDEGSLVKPDAGSGDNIMFQAQERKLGQIRISPNRQITTVFFKDMNESTFIHETGHLLLEIMADTVESPNASQQIKDDWNLLLKELGIKDRTELKKPYADRKFNGEADMPQEAFARMFERYTMEGIAPSIGLRRAFATFAAWMRDIYRKYTNYGGELNDNVRRVMDRMLASQEEIDAARQESGVDSMTDYAERFITSEKELAKYKKDVADARAIAEEKVIAAGMANIVRERKKWYKEETARVRNEVAQEIHNQPVYIAIANLQRGKRADGSPLPDEMPSIKLDRQEIIDRYGESKLRELPGPNSARNRGNYVYSRSNGIDLESAAAMFFFQSADQMMEQLLSAGDMNAMIESETESIMLKKHGDPLMDGTLTDVAVKAIQSDKQAQIMMLEAKHLFNNAKSTFKNTNVRVATQVRIPELESIRSNAREAIGKQVVSTIDPQLYLHAQARQNKLAVKLMLNGDFDGAFKTKLQALLNHELYKAAQDAREKADDAALYMRRFEKDSVRKKIGLGGQQYLERVDEIMSRFDFTKVPKKNLSQAANLADWIAKHPDLQTQNWVFDDKYANNYQNLTYSDLMSVVDTVKQLEHFAQTDRQLMLQKQKQDFRDTVDIAQATAEQNTKKLTPAKIASMRTSTDDSLDLVNQFVVSHVKLPTWMHILDGGDQGGFFWNLMARPINEAADNRAHMNREIAAEQKRIWDKWREAGGVDGKGMNNVRDGLVYIPSIGSWNFESRFMVALYSGNAGNIDRLVTGMEWSEEQRQAVLNTLNKRDFELMQDIFDHLSSYWPQISELEKKMIGIEPEKVDASPVETKHGTFPGGYFPIRTDRLMSANAAKKDISSGAVYELGTAMNYSTRRGLVKARAEAGIGSPILFSLNSMNRHFDELTLDLTHREVMHDMKLLMNDNQFRGVLHDHIGPHAISSIDKLMRDITSDQNDNDVIDRFAQHSRVGVTIFSIAGSIKSVLSQISGVGPSIQRVGLVPFAQAAKTIYGNPANTLQIIQDIGAKEKFMQDRMTSQWRSSREVFDSYRGWSPRKKAIARMGFWLIGRMQMAIDAPTWLAAFNNAKAQNFDDKTAAQMGNQAVLDSQGGGHTKDLSPVQRNKIGQFLTIFMGPMNAQMNLAFESYMNARNKSWSKDSTNKFMMDMLLVYAVPAAVMTGIAVAAGKMGPDETYAGRFLKETLDNTLGGVAGVREVSGAIQSGYGYHGSASERGLSSIVNTAQQIYQGDPDVAALNAALEMVGIWYHLPTGQLIKGINGITYMQDNNSSDPRPLLFGPPPKR